MKYAKHKTKVRLEIFNKNLLKVKLKFIILKANENYLEW